MALSLIKSKKFLAPLAQYASELPESYCRGEGQIGGWDIEVLYCFVRWLKPKRIVELGTGQSTRIMLDAAKKNGNLISFYTIDPKNGGTFAPEVIAIPKSVEQIDLAVFKELEPGDFLFIDPSHEASEQTYLVNNVFDILAPGVYIQHHDWRILDYANKTFLDWPDGHPFKNLWTNGSGEMQVFLDYVKKFGRINMIHANSMNMGDPELHAYMRSIFKYTGDPFIHDVGSLYSKVIK